MNPTTQAPSGNVQTGNPNPGNQTGQANPQQANQLRMLEQMRSEFSQIEQGIHANRNYETALDKLIQQAEQLRSYVPSH